MNRPTALDTVEITSRVVGSNTSVHQLCRGRYLDRGTLRQSGAAGDVERKFTGQLSEGEHNTCQARGSPKQRATARRVPTGIVVLRAAGTGQPEAVGHGAEEAVAQQAAHLELRQRHGARAARLQQRDGGGAAGWHNVWRAAAYIAQHRGVNAAGAAHNPGGARPFSRS